MSEPCKGDHTFTPHCNLCGMYLGHQVLREIDGYKARIAELKAEVEGERASSTMNRVIAKSLQARIDRALEWVTTLEKDNVGPSYSKRIAIALRGLRTALTGEKE